MFVHMLLMAQIMFFLCPRALAPPMHAISIAQHSNDTHAMSTEERAVQDLADLTALLDAWALSQGDVSGPKPASTAPPSDDSPPTIIIPMGTAAPVSKATQPCDQKVHTPTGEHDYLPLCVWAARGYDVELIRTKSATDDRRTCPVLGELYRVVVMSRGDRGSTHLTSRQGRGHRGRGHALLAPSQQGLQSLLVSRLRI